MSDTETRGNTPRRIRTKHIGGLTEDERRTWHLPIPAAQHVSGLKIGSAPSESAQAAAKDFLSGLEESNAEDVVAEMIKFDPEVFGAALLSQINTNVSTNHEESKKVFQALEYVKAGIQQRSKSQGIYFSNGDMYFPEDVFIHVLGFLDKRDLIDSVSHVSCAWARASLSPGVSLCQGIE